MSFVMFDVYTTEPQILDDPDAEALASELERNGLNRLAGRIRYGLANDTLVEVDPTEHGFLVEALAAALKVGAAGSEHVAALARNLQARVAGVEAVLTGQIGESIRVSAVTDSPARRLEFHFGDVRQRLDLHEALILAGLLERERNPAARRLARRISTANVTGESVEMNAHEFSALCALVRDSDELADLRTELIGHLRDLPFR